MKTLTLFLLITLSLFGFGQNLTDLEPEKPFIEVTGTVEHNIIPDEIYISITIRERHKGKEKITIEKQEANLKEALKSIGISLDNLSLSDKNADYIKVKWSKMDVIAKAEYILKVDDAVSVGKVFEKLDELKILDANISRVSHSEIEEFKKEVRILAIKAAKEKADYLLITIGEQTGKALIVREVGSFHKLEDSYLNTVNTRNNEFQSQNKAEDKIIQFQKIKLQAAIYVKFEIK